MYYNICQVPDTLYKQPTNPQLHTCVLLYAPYHSDEHPWMDNLLYGNLGQSEQNENSLVKNASDDLS